MCDTENIQVLYKVMDMNVEMRDKRVMIEEIDLLKMESNRFVEDEILSKVF